MAKDKMGLQDLQALVGTQTVEAKPVALSSLDELVQSFLPAVQEELTVSRKVSTLIKELGAFAPLHEEAELQRASLRELKDELVDVEKARALFLDRYVQELPQVRQAIARRKELGDILCASHSKGGVTVRALPPNHWARQKILLLDAEIGRWRQKLAGPFDKEIKRIGKEIEDEEQRMTVNGVFQILDEADALRKEYSGKVAQEAKI
jgi:hypothetical protein